MPGDVSRAKHFSSRLPEKQMPVTAVLLRSTQDECFTNVPKLRSQSRLPSPLHRPECFRCPVSCVAPFLNPNVLAVSALQVLLPVSCVALALLHPIHGALAFLTILECPSRPKTSKQSIRGD